MPSRRTFVAAVGTATAASLAGCPAIPDGSPGSSADPPPESGVDSLPDPDGHVHGADGEWLSFGCNAGNTRTVADGEAPVDGVTERWRVEVPQLTYTEPLAVDGRVYQPTPTGLGA